MRLRSKFNLVLLFSFALGLAGTAYVADQVLRVNARAEVLQRALIMMESASAIRRYTATEIRPLLRLQLQRQFLPHSVPSFAAQTNFQALRQAFPNYRYKEAALNPTNPSDRATDWEADLIETFRNDRERQEIVIQRDSATGPALVLAHPIAITSEGCLQCHSTPEGAPETMVAKYGRSNGFGWQMNEVVGAQVVSVPMSVPLDRARETFAAFMGGLSAVFLAVVVLINALLHFVVVRPIKRMASVADDVSMGGAGVPEYVPKGRDEVAVLGAAFNRMRRSMENALRLLDDDRG